MELFTLSILSQKFTMALLGTAASVGDVTCMIKGALRPGYPSDGPYILTRTDTPTSLRV